MNQILALNLEKRSVAFCFLDHDYKINRFGGSLETYGLRNLKEGQRADNVFPFLEETFAESRESRLIRHVALESGVFADVHLIFHEKGLWIVFLDATQEVERLALMQQRGNEANLLKEKIKQVSFQLEAANSRIEKLQAELDSAKKVDSDHSPDGE
ncbi:MAG: hypothetical protein V1897_07260 [Pseudomonadota bacterium]